MKNALLLLALLVGLFSGHADSREKNVIVVVIAGIPDGSWHAYNAAVSKMLGENTPYRVEVIPLESGMADISFTGLVMECGESDFIPSPDSSAQAQGGIGISSNKNIINDIVVSSMSLIPPWEPLDDASACGYCRADIDDMVSLNRIGVAEDLIRNMLDALHQFKNEFQRNESHIEQRPLHARERGEKMQAAQ